MMMSNPSRRYNALRGFRKQLGTWSASRFWEMDINVALGDEHECGIRRMYIHVTVPSRKCFDLASGIAPPRLPTD